MKDFYASVSDNGSKLLLKSKETDRILEELNLIKALPEHRNYIISTWVKSYEKHARKCGFRSEYYRAGESKLAEGLWDGAMVAVSGSDPYTVHAWVCGYNGYLAHVYVPPELRNHGVARALVELVAGKEYSVHKPWPRTPAGHKVTWNPYLVAQ